MATGGYSDVEACRRFDPRPPEGWVVRQSTTRPGVFYYVNKGTGDTAVERPNPVPTGGGVPRANLPNIHAIWVGRDKLLDWHQKLEGRFASMVVGFYIRFRLEDSANGKAHYKVGRIRGVTDEWRIFIDLGKGLHHRGDTTGIDCVSNSIFTPDEVKIWQEGLDQAQLPTLITDVYHTETRLRNIEAELKNMPDTTPRKKDKRGPQQPPQQQQQQQQPQANPQWRGPATPSKLPSNAGPAGPNAPSTPPNVLLQQQGGVPGMTLNKDQNQAQNMPSGVSTPNQHRSRSRSQTKGANPAGQYRASSHHQSHVGYFGQQHYHPPHPKTAILSPQVLLLDDRGDTKGMCTMSDVVTRATTVEPDTPMGSGPGFDPFALADAGAEQDILGTESTKIRIKDLEASEPLDESSRPREATTVLHMIMEAAVDGGREFVYHRPRELGTAILQLCRAVKPILEREPLMQRLASPLYIFGDIHGNFADLYCFMKNIISFGELSYTAADLLFLGDYVDRGTCSVECIVFLLAYKLLSPDKIFLMRGNHESPEVNGDVATYGTVSFRHQCLMVFGEDMGTQVWTQVNNLFRYFALTAVIDDRIFCSHGGIPQYYGGPDTRLDILDKPNFPRFEEIQSSNPEIETRDYRQFVSDLLWSDPAEPGTSLNEHGFGSNPRGPGIKTFGKKAVDVFLANHGFDYIIRAHQEKSNGLRLSDSARVITIFSSSDYGGHQNGAGVLLISKGRIRMAIKDPTAQAYHQQDVHLPQGGGRRSAW